MQHSLKHDLNEWFKANWTKMQLEQVSGFFCNAIRLKQKLNEWFTTNRIDMQLKQVFGFFCNAIRLKTEFKWMIAWSVDLIKVWFRTLC